MKVPSSLRENNFGTTLLSGSFVLSQDGVYSDDREYLDFWDILETLLSYFSMTTTRVELPVTYSVA